jgi:hypothetical protein
MEKLNMKNIIKYTTITMAVLAFSTVSAVSTDTESRLLEQVLLEGAVTPGQKTAVNRYFNNIAIAKKQEANKYKNMASVARGGKSRTQDFKTKEFLEKANQLESEASYYEKASVADNSVELYRELASR